MPKRWECSESLKMEKENLRHRSSGKKKVKKRGSVVRKSPALKRKKLKKSEAYVLHKPDFILFFCVVLLLILGALMVYSATWPESLKEYGNANTMALNQLKAMAIGFLVMLLAYIIPIGFYGQPFVSFLIFAFAIALNLLTKTSLGVEHNGAKRWLIILGQEFMPSDIMKIAGIIAISAFIAFYKDKLKPIFGNLGMILILAIAVVVVYIQKDLGTSAVLAAVLAVLAFLGGLSLIMVVIGGSGAAFLATKALSSESFRMARLSAFKDPFQDKLGTGLQAVQSLYALGSGGIFGKGVGRSVQKYFYLPFSFNDFIFSIMGEELGFIGASFYLLVLLIFVFRGLWIAKNVRAKFQKSIAIGIVMTVAIQSIVHILVALSALPTKGISLPFISQGGTSLVLFMGMAGILFQISRMTEFKQ